MATKTHLVVSILPLMNSESTVSSASPSPALFSPICASIWGGGINGSRGDELIIFILSPPPMVHLTPFSPFPFLSTLPFSFTAVFAHSPPPLLLGMRMNVHFGRKKDEGGRMRMQIGQNFRGRNNKQKEDERREGDHPSPEEERDTMAHFMAQKRTNECLVIVCCPINAIRSSRSTL